MADFDQVGNQSWQTMTPGSAVAGQLQNILLNKRLEARQAMLDQLAQQRAATEQQNVDSQIKSRDAQNAYNAERIKGLTEDRKAQETQRRVGLMNPHQNLAPGDESYLQENAPSLIDPAQAGTVPLGPGEQGPEKPAIPAQFHGLPAQLETERKLNLQKDLQGIMSDPTKWDPMPDAQKEALYHAAYGVNIPENVLRPNSGGKIWSYDPVTQTTKQVGSKGPNDVVQNAGRPPRPLQDPAALRTPVIKDFTVQDPNFPNDPTKTIVQSHWLKPGEQPSDTNKINGLRVSGPPKPPAPPKAGSEALYDDKAFKDLQLARRSTVPGAKELFGSAVTNFVKSVSKYDKQVGADIEAIRGDADLKALPFEQLVSSGVLSGDPAHLEKVKTALDIIRGQ